MFVTEYVRSQHYGKAVIALVVKRFEWTGSGSEIMP